MSDLSAQLSAFKNKIRSGPSVVVPRRPIQPQVKAEVPANGAPGKRSGGDSMAQVFKRQRALANQMSGLHLSTQMHLAVEYIKQQDAPVPVAKLQEYLNFDIHGTLLPLLKEIDRVRYDPKTDTLEYVSLHNIRSLDDLLNFLRSQPTFKGVAVKELRDGWLGCLDAIAELEALQKILVLKTKKENAPRCIWANLGGEMGLIDEEFCTMWSQVRLPDPDGLYQALLDQGLKPTGADPMELKKKPQQVEKKQKKARRGKITNTHMKGVFKDYSSMQ
jgi:transcription initiation factor TFIIE subunit beta